MSMAWRMCECCGTIKSKTYQILPETFHDDYQKNEIEFKMQIIINDK